MAAASYVARRQQPGSKPARPASPLSALRAPPPQIIVATGFIAKSPEGQATTLRRNGSDLSATIMGSLFQCAHISIWTDVDGVYSVRGAARRAWERAAGGCQ
jgi:aspartokinase